MVEKPRIYKENKYKYKINNKIMENLEKGNLGIEEAVDILLDQANNQVTPELVKLRPSYTGSFAEVGINGVDYQIQVTITPNKKEWIKSDKVRINFDDEQSPTLDMLF